MIAIVASILLTIAIGVLGPSAMVPVLGGPAWLPPFSLDARPDPHLVIAMAVAAVLLGGLGLLAGLTAARRVASRPKDHPTRPPSTPRNAADHPRPHRSTVSHLASDHSTVGRITSDHGTLDHNPPADHTSPLHQPPKSTTPEPSGPPRTTTPRTGPQPATPRQPPEHPQKRPLRRDDHGLPTARLLVLIGCVAAGLLAFLPPSGSGDHLNYAAYGRMVVLGVDPYTHGAVDLPADPIAKAVEEPWREEPSVYGPVATGAQALASWVGGDSLKLTMFVLALLNSAAFIVTGLLIDRFTRHDPARRLRAALLWTANPLLLYQLVAGMHLDTLAIACMMAALLARGRPLGSGLLLGLGVAIKVNAGLVALGPAWELRRRPGRLALMAGAALAVVVAGYAIVGTDAISPVTRTSKAISHASYWKLVQGWLQTLVGEGSAYRGEIQIGSLLVLTLIAWSLFRLSPHLTPPGTPTAGTPSSGAATAGTPSAGAATAGTPSAGTPSAGTPSAGTPSAGTPSAGTPSSGTPSAGTPSSGTPSSGGSSNGAPGAGASSAGAPPTGVLSNGIPNTTGLPAEVVAAVLVAAYVFATPYILPWYDGMAFALVALVAATAVDGFLVVHLLVLSLAYLPARVISLPADLDWLRAVVRPQVVPWMLLALTAALVWWAWRSAGPVRKPRATAAPPS
ncbi:MULTISPECIES: polyprenol phosphomannose-dependent alpha 1,6 mannosyltransferase MptB [unclassified Nonomuraea]|uniref:polyprenol phosphomannose-dependent alpha 1,6 mannosyltransferase MptB n=1 Tax=unclassified Nonomuraea TaxID=2593643 RepID=UPI0033C5E7C7